ncbi:MAG: citrate synthase [Desulfurococcaceae archaeon]|nr:MAG: citrate synthase [Desulfurococcaceae archaeon]
MLYRSFGKRKKPISGPASSVNIFLPKPYLYWWGVLSSSKPQIFKGLEGVYVSETRLSYIDGLNSRLYYVGYRIEDLVAFSNYEEVAFLLYFYRLPKKEEFELFRALMREAREVPPDVADIVKRMALRNAHPMDILRTCVSYISMYDPELYVGTREANIRKAVRLVSKMPTLVALIYRVSRGLEPIEPRKDLGHAENFLYMLHGKVPSEFEAKVMDTIFILHAEHGMNASSFASLVTASTLADIYSAVVSGISTLKGPLHGGAAEAAYYQFKEIGEPERVEAWVQEALKARRRIMGMGHRVYKSYDPRAKIMKELDGEIASKYGGEPEKLYKIAIKLEEVALKEFEARGRTDIQPNIDYYTPIAYTALKIPPELFTLTFAASRTVGWTAKVIEYVQDNRLIRPLDYYIGELDKKYIPITER